MEVQFVYAAMSVSDIASATGYYARLLGRQPDDRPMDTLVQWRFPPNAGIPLFADVERAGDGTMTLVVPAMDAAGDRLAAQGIDIGTTSQGDYGRIARFSDPDGNNIVLSESPSVMPAAS